MDRLLPLETLLRAARRSGHIFANGENAWLRLRQKHPLLSGALVAPILLAGLSVGAAVQLVPLLVQPFGSAVIAEIRESDARKQGTAVHDAKGRFVGLLPGSLDSDSAYNPGPNPETGFDELGRPITLWPDHKTLFVENPSIPYVACIRRLEDSQIGHPIINPHGVDAIALTRPFTSLGKAGGSGLSAQLVQTLIRPKASNGKYRRKFEEVFWTVPLFHGHAPGDRRFDQYLARHLPHLRYMQYQQGTIWGIEASAQILFGKASANLSPPQLFVLAGATRRPIIFPLAHDIRNRALRDVSSESRKTWDQAISRARICAADPAIMPDAFARAQALTALSNMARALPAPQGDPAIMALGEARYGARWPERARNPFWRTIIFSHNAMQALPLEFKEGLGLRWSRKVTQVRLSFDITDERRFSPSFRARMRQWLANREDLNPIYRPWATYTPDQPEPQTIPEIILGVTDADGRLVRYYSSRADQPYFGSKRAPDGLYQIEREDRQLASVGKVAGALALLKSGRADERVFRAFAESDTDAFEQHLAADSAEETNRFMVTHLRWSDRSARDAFGRPLSLSHSISHGTLSASPRTAQWGALAITNALAGDIRLVRPPSLIGQVRLVDLDRGRLVPGIGFLPTAYGRNGQIGTLDPSMLVSAMNRDRAILLLSAPICRGGTLSALKHWCAAQRTRFIWGKTGTYDMSKSYALQTGQAGGKGTVLRVSAVGGVEFSDGRRFSYFLSVGGIDQRSPLTLAGKTRNSLEASRLSPLLDWMLHDIDRRDQSPKTGNQR